MFYLQFFNLNCVLSLLENLHRHNLFKLTTLSRVYKSVKLFLYTTLYSIYYSMAIRKEINSDKLINYEYNLFIWRQSFSI